MIIFNKCSKNSPTSSGGEMNCTSEHICSKKAVPTELTLRDTAYSFTGGSSIIAFQFYYYMSVRFFSLTDCLYIAVALQRCMDDPSFVRIHRFQNYRFSGFLYLEGDSSCKVLQSFFSPSAVVLSVYFYADIGTVSFVYHKIGRASCRERV